ncbi:AAA family ATPase [Streptomyces sp. NPDC005096]|uniref:AAA family ATPase n=1 Tax=Streptomyces sp. NPDC005096 TaxID=3154559 RepID=UPI0033A5564A
MTEQHAPTTFKRRLVLIAVSDYDEGTPTQQAAFRTGISAQVAVVEDWWAGTHLEKERRFKTSKPPKLLHGVHDLRAFLIDEDLADADDDEALVIYITGHGLAPAHQHFLRMPDSREGRPLSTAFPTAELIVTALDSPAEHVLVMVDSCFSGRLEDELRENLKALTAERRALASLVVLTAGNDDSRPRLQAFTSALAAIRAHCEEEANGYARSHLSWEDWDTILEAVWDRTTMADIHRIWPTSRASRQRAARELSPVLPNPGYTDTTILEDARSQVGWSRADLDDYWISRATGQMTASDAGWYFTGRTHLIKRMTAFLNSDDGVLIVTGQAGSGKSALLARLVTLSDPRFRADEIYRHVLESLPAELDVPLGAVNAAVLARNMDPHELSAALYEAVTGRPAPADQDIVQLLRNHARNTALHRDTPLTVVIDGIDEARYPRRLITDVLRPLADLRIGNRPAVRLILGIRSSPMAGQGARSDEPVHPGLVDLLQRATNAGPPIRTDDSTAVDDIAAYTLALLRAHPVTGSHLLQLDDSLVLTAAAVANEVTPSFLDARLAAQQLHSRTVRPRPDDTHWRRQLRQGTHELLRQDLHDVAQHTGQRVESLLAVLRATAFAEGSGLPWADIWPAALCALDPALDTDPHILIRLVRDSRLTGYLTTTVEDGRTVYRPIHERISETLRTSPHILMTGEEHITAHSNATQVHRQLATAFASLLKDFSGHPPHPYLRRHLVAHATAGQVLDDAHVPASFLPWESRGNVRGSLGLPITTTLKRKALAAWSHIEHFLADAPATARADSLTLALSSTDDPATSPTTGQGTHITPRWNRLRPAANVLAGTTSDIYELITFTTADNTTVLAAGHADGSVTMWDPHTGTPFGLPFTGLGRHARTMAVITNKPGRDPLFAVGTDAGLWLCDPQTGQASHLSQTPVRALAAFTGPDHRALLAVGIGPETRVLDPFTGESLAYHLPPIPESFTRRRAPLIHTLAVVELRDDRTLLAVGREDHYVQLLDALTLEPVGQVHGQGRGVAALLAYTTDDGEPRLVTASRSTKTVRVWDLVTGTEHKTAPIKEAVSSMAIFRDTASLWGRWGRPLLVTASSREEEAHLRLWDPDTGELVHEIPTEHTKRVRGLAVFDGPGDTPVIASGSFDRTIRLWNLTTAQPLKQLRIPAATHLVQRPSTAGPPHLIAAGRGGEIDLRSAETGTRLESLGLEDDAKKEVTALAVPDVWPGTAPTAVGYSDGALRLLTPQGSWQTLCEANGYLHSRVRALAIIPNAEPQQTLLAAGFSNSWVGYWHLDHTVHQQRPARHDADGPVRALAALPGTDGPLLAVATRAVRLLHPGYASHARLPERIGSVRALASFTTPEDAHPLLVTGGTDGAVRLWHPAAPRKEAYPPLQGHRGAISAITSLHHPTMQTPLLVTAGSDDTSIRLWDHQTGEEVLRLVTAAPVTALTVLPPTAQLGHDPVIVFGGPRGLAAVAVRL